MIKIIITTIFIWFTAFHAFVFAQNITAPAAYTETIVVHINTDFLITGETLYYSIHCLEAEKSTPSRLSKVAYVELIGENEEPVLQTKVSLIEGRGAGDFFLPSTLPSGNYTLIAYTKWMRNFPFEYFFQRQITIINPYLKPFDSEKENKADKTSVFTRASNQKNETGLVQLSVDKEKYSLRQKVIVVIKNNDLLHDCKISLNVHRDDKNADAVNSKNSDTVLLQRSLVKKEAITFLPDLRGETIGGIVTDSYSHKPIANREIYLSSSGSSSIFQMSRTDSAGRFHFIAKNIQAQNGIRFQIDEPSGSVPVEIVLDNEFVNEYRKFKPLPFSLDTTLRRQIEQRNVYSQIENAYFFRKQDSVPALTQELFFGKPDKIYRLDDFTRFPTMEDVFREYMFEVVVLKRDGKFALRLINSNSRSAARFLNGPLILVDGVRVFDTEILMNYNPLLIKKVALITRSYVYAGVLFDGILSVETYAGDAKELPVLSIQKEYTPWQRSTKYYSPVYNGNEKLDRIPDYRFQLFWNPAITIEPGNEFVVEFYTSDLDGNFLIEAKGFNSKGEVVDISDRIEVVK